MRHQASFAAFFYPLLTPSTYSKVPFLRVSSQDQHSQLCQGVTSSERNRHQLRENNIKVYANNETSNILTVVLGVPYTDLTPIFCNIK